MFFIDIIPLEKSENYTLTVREDRKALYTGTCRSKKALHRYIRWHKRRHGEAFVKLTCRGGSAGLEGLGLL